MSSDTVYEDESMPGRPNPARAGLGCLFMLPAIILCIGTLLLPTTQVFNTSLTNNNGLNTATVTYVGMANYTRELQDPVFSKALSNTLFLTLIRLAAVAIIPPILALA